MFRYGIAHTLADPRDRAV